MRWRATCWSRSEIDPAVPPVAGDPVLIRQALLNIVTDALEATSLSTHKEAPIRIDVRPSGDAVEITVRHFGLRAEGVGLDDWSLALARSVVAAHRASLTVTGTAETGISVVTTWPAHAG